MNLVYEHDASGNSISGSLVELREAVLSAQEIKFSLVFSDVTNIFTPNRVFVDSETGHVYAEAELNLHNFSVNSAGSCTFVYDSTPGIAVFGTNGKEVYRLNGGNFETNNLAIKWWV